MYARLRDGLLQLLYERGVARHHVRLHLHVLAVHAQRVQETLMAVYGVAHLDGVDHLPAGAAGGSHQGLGVLLERVSGEDVVGSLGRVQPVPPVDVTDV